MKPYKHRYPIMKYNFEYKRILNEIKEKYNFDYIIVNTRFHLTSHVAARFGKKNNIPVFLIEHGSNYVSVSSKFWDFFANRYENFLTWKIKRKINGFYGVSKAASDWLINFKIDASGVWYNSIDTDIKLHKREKHNSINFMYAGRIIKEKGVENILISFNNLYKKYKNIHLFIAGDGAMLDEYKNKYENKNIEFLGKLNFDELLEYYSKTDVFLYPTLYPEGLPTSILEAGLNKCAVIATNKGGVMEVIENNKSGYVIDDTREDLEEKMEDLIVNKDKIEKFGEELNKTVIEKFSWKSTAKKVLEDMENAKD